MFGTWLCELVVDLLSRAIWFGLSSDCFGEGHSLLVGQRVAWTVPAEHLRGVLLEGVGFVAQ